MPWHVLAYQPSRCQNVLAVPIAINVSRCVGSRWVAEVGYVLRDLKPENILCSSNGVDIKIADFGLSNSVSSSQQALRSQCGTPVYMAPEMLQKHPYGPSVDVSCSCRDERRHSWSCQAPHKLPADVRCLWGRSGPRGL